MKSGMDKLHERGNHKNFLKGHPYDLTEYYIETLSACMKGQASTIKLHIPNNAHFQGVTSHSALNSQLVSPHYMGNQLVSGSEESNISGNYFCYSM